MLRDYIEAVVRRIATERLNSGHVPARCEFRELCKQFEKDALEIWRQLHKEGVFEGHQTVNKEPMLILKDNEISENNDTRTATRQV